MPLLLGLRAAFTAGISTFRSNFANRALSARFISQGNVLRSEEDENFDEDDDDKKKPKERIVDPAKDRRNPVSVETSIRYLASDAYKETYADNPVWKLYRRNHKGSFPPKKTRQRCVRNGVIATGNPCPICRDEYLILDHTNVALLKQFISEFNGETLSYQKTGICQMQHRNLLIAIIRARDYGTITFDVPFREYNYADWYKPEEDKIAAAESQ